MRSTVQNICINYGVYVKKKREQNNCTHAKYKKDLNTPETPPNPPLVFQEKNCIHMYTVQGHSERILKIKQFAQALIFTF